MKHTTQLILALTILGASLLPGCGRGSSSEVTAAPSADHLVQFNDEGIAVLRGYLSGGYFCTSDGTLREILDIEVPAQTEGIDLRVALSFALHLDTEIASSLVPQTDLRGYHNARPDAPVFNAFPGGVLVEVTFLKTDSAFEAVAVHEVTHTDDSSPEAVVIDPVFSTDLFSRGMIRGTIHGSSLHEEGAMTWTLSMPMTIQGIEAAVLLPVESTPETQVITSSGAVPMTAQHPMGSVQVEFTRQGDTLIAREFTEIP